MLWTASFSQIGEATAYAIRVGLLHPWPCSRARRLRAIDSLRPSFGSHAPIRPTSVGQGGRLTAWCDSQPEISGIGGLDEVGVRGGPHGREQRSGIRGGAA